MNATRQCRILIVGTGFSGLCMAIKLRAAGVHDFVVLEKAGEVGGTWRENHYPGAECDVPSALYSFSFESKPDWDYTWSEQPQILEYLKHSAEKYSLHPHIHFKREVLGARYDNETSTWTVQTRQGETYRCHFLICAVGQLHHPYVPAIRGSERFAGEQFHSARWRHDLDLSGKRVAVIGNAASAVQFIPEIAPRVEQLAVYQRSANWVSRKFDRPRRRWQQRALERLPLLLKLARLKIYLRNELLAYPAMRGRRWAAAIMRRVCLNYLHDVIKDPALRRKLTPDYPVGAKRILLVDGYCEALARDNTSLVTDAIREITEHGIVTDDGVERHCDVIIYGTGFVTNPFLVGLDIRGPGDVSLAEHWAAGAHAYLGVQTHGFPNVFMLYGPNTNLGHNSIVLMSEAQADYILAAIQHCQASGQRAIEVKGAVESEYNRELQRRLRRMVWNRVSASWYRDGERITNNWPGSVGEYRSRLRRFRPETCHFSA